MATLITVHGTSDTGSEDGDKWWQRGGALDQDLRRWVTSDAGPVTVTPQVWHGENSEAGRYAAAGELMQKAEALEEAGEPYCLLGHSHGGSVIAHMLAQAQYRKRTLGNLQSWITVGTPFIHARRRALLFSRLKTPGIAALMILVYLTLMWAAFSVSSIYLAFVAGDGLKNPTFDGLVLVLAPLFIAALYLVLWRSQPHKLRTMNPRSGAARAEAFSDRWLGLWHCDDEVINGGRVLKDVKFAPFRPEFASPLFAFTSLLLIPVILWFAASAELYEVLSKRIAVWDEIFTASDDPDIFKTFARDSLAIVCLPAIGIFEMLRGIGIAPTKSAIGNNFVIGTVLAAGAAIGFLCIWLLAMLLHRIVLESSSLISRVLSNFLNRLTRQQVIALGYGSDSKGESAIGAYPYPDWIAREVPSLPPALEAEITRSSDEAASKALSRLRQALSTLDLGEGKEAGDLLTRHVTWSELVHTNYFRVPQMRKLIAFAISQQQGFRPTEEFRRDPEFALVEIWFRHVSSAPA